MTTRDASAAHAATELEPPRSSFRVAYVVRSLVAGNAVVSTGEAVLEAADKAEARRLAVDWAHDNDPRCDERVGPMVRVTRVARVPRRPVIAPT